MLYDMEKLRRQVEQRLSPARYRHSVAVQKAAMSLAKQYRADWYKAGVAGLLHDICHDMTPQAQLNYLRSCGILLDIFTLENPSLLHAIAGSVYIREAMGVDDEEILSAVRFHTTARRDMTTLEKVVYVADLVSEDRSFPDSAMLRQMAGQSLDAVLHYSLSYTMHKLIQGGKPIVQDAWEAYNAYRPVAESTWAGEEFHL